MVSTMQAIPKSTGLVSPEEYLEGERFSDVRHEYVDGTLYAMAGASRDHNIISGNIFADLRSRLRGGPCQPFIPDMKLKVPTASGAFYYPDVMVVCDPKDTAEHFCEWPSVIFEVISPETKRIDLNEKLLVYRGIASMQTYVILEQDRMAAIVHHRTADGWQTSIVHGDGAILRLPSLNLDFPLSLVYEGTSLPPV
jgi:Uma2 family endonuclease